MIKVTEVEGVRYYQIGPIWFGEPKGIKYRIGTIMLLAIIILLITMLNRIGFFN
jgi:hypothetical protein